eukprot:jgi/Astpho2/3666/Aster-07867
MLGMMQGPLEELLNMTEHGRSMSRFTGAPGHRNKAAQSSAAQSRAHHVGEQGWQAGSAAERHRSARQDHAVAHTQSAGLVNATVWWHAPFFSGGGYSSEAVGFVTALHRAHALPEGQLWATQHGDSFKEQGIAALAEGDLQILVQLTRAARGLHQGRLVVVCHSEPGAWSAPHAAYESPALCPPPNLPGQVVTVGRTMFETDRISPEHARRCNTMDQVWVPAAFHRDIFAANGVNRGKLRVVPEPVDATFFNPEVAIATRLPIGRRVFGQSRAAAQQRQHAGKGTSVLAPTAAAKPFVFLSIFKWEERKGHDVLLSAYLKEFSVSDNVELYLKTAPFHGSSNFLQQMHAWAEQHLSVDPRSFSSLPKVYVISSHLSQAQLRSLYKADAFVLPSRGEGWGRPHVEAMSMQLPVLATNWSGPTAFLDDTVGYPLAIDGLVPASGAAFAGHKWAAPSVAHLQLLMRQVISNPDQARKKGRLARERMMQFAPATVAAIVRERLMELAS